MNESTIEAGPETEPSGAGFWDRWCSARGALVLFAVALLVRAIYVFELHDFALVKYPIVDAQTYHLWAEAILRGEQFDSGVFYQDPLFPYMLALLYRLTTTSVMLAIGVQVVLDAATVVMIAWLGQRVFSPAVGGLAGVAAALYGVFVFNTSILDKTTVSQFAVTAALCAIYVAARSRRFTTAAVAGLVTGIAMLLRGNVYLFVPVAGLWLAWRFRGLAPTRWLALTALFAVGGALAIAPVTVRNYVVGGDLVLTTSQSGWNFYKGTSAEATGFLNDPLNTNNVPQYEETQVRLLAEERTGRDLLPSEVSDYWWSQGFAYIRAEPVAYAKLNLLKLWYLFNGYEIPDSYDFYYFRDHSITLHAMFVGFWLVSPLGLIGIALMLARRRVDGDQLLLLGFVATYAASVVLFYNASRYRLPLATALLLYAAVAASWVHARVRAREFGRAAVVGALAIGMVVLLNTHSAEGEIDPDYNVFTEGCALLENGEPERALERFERIYDRGRNRVPLVSNRALAFRKTGRYPESIEAFRHAVRLSPIRLEFHDQLIWLYRKVGDRPRAELFKALRQVFAGQRRRGLAKLSRLAAEAERDVKLDAYAHVALIGEHFGDPDLVDQAWGQYLEAAPDTPAILLRVFEHNERRRPERARTALRRYLEVVGDRISAERRAELERRLAQLGR